MALRDLDNPASPLVPKELDELLDYIPALKRMESIEIDYITPFDPPLDSADVEPQHWVKMARIIRDNYYDYDGFVILHGTDTIAYTSSVLPFIIYRVKKLSGDAPRNLLN